MKRCSSAAATPTPACAPALARRKLKSLNDLAHHTLLQHTTRPQAWQEWLSAAGARDVDLPPLKYDEALRQRAITQSMSRKGNCFDNAVIESFLATLKTELYHPNRFRSLDELQEGIAQYIHYYNHDRINYSWEV